ncbi:hypothetical protein METBIDRAFT_74423 [Metschnikowia bicuspidata var. bicuspidata NRRL YB-4993]|uniref:Uncharacterized protein n=1 Tax=Metschnikowia bicuspidata var. bicuspidata NRRL YB-4993 TaxID=869754 RepID=A0A1A0H5D5_9ASCO|nr:hypothetical protein METBIDRAFT_74423 [Metschnikowia bicuspidata var. bicuspidata NRRL YB-4993]OBA19246.1 hypothetical protein METBIDRAFT_74423 [Metschnikowia bicuspidata var. bicuspidata NRRL YB-4993]
MASAASYDPDDFENNNPFAEPEHSPPLVKSDYGSGSADVTSSVAHFSSAQGDFESSSTGELVKEELMRLIPERFNDKYTIKLKLRAIEENKPGNPILRFDATVNGLLKYRQKEYTSIRRTYSEVLAFNKYLLVSNLEVFVPVIPLARTSYPTGGDDEKKQLMYVWQEWMNRVTHNPILVRDEEFVYFIENDFGYTVINSNRKSTVASGFLRKTLKQLAVPYDPYQELAEFRPMIKSAYTSGMKLHKALEKNQRNYKQLASFIAELSTKLKGLAQFETVHPGMKNMWEKLSNVAHIQSELALLQLISDMGSLGDGTQALVDNLYEIKEALTNRHLIMRELLQAQAETRSKHLNATKIKNKSSLDPIKVDEALSSLELATKAEESLNMQVKRILGEMMFERKEAIGFYEKKFQRTLKLFSLARIDQHRKLLKHLENIRVDVRIIDANGGLSRLNRDNLTQMKHNLHQSQAEMGDAWSSRTFRSLSTENAEELERLRVRELGDEESMDARQAASVLGSALFSV